MKFIITRFTLKFCRAFWSKCWSSGLYQWPWVFERNIIICDMVKPSRIIVINVLHKNCHWGITNMHILSMHFKGAFVSYGITPVTALHLFCKSVIYTVDTWFEHETSECHFFSLLLAGLLRVGKEKMPFVYLKIVCSLHIWSWYFLMNDWQVASKCQQSSLEILRDCSVNDTQKQTSLLMIPRTIIREKQKNNHLVWLWGCKELNENSQS